MLQVSNKHTTVVHSGQGGGDVYIGGVDTFMAGWGGAEGGRSFAIWSCSASDADAVMAWVESRGDIERPRVITGTLTTKPKDHVHVYNVNHNHISLQEDN